ncbi:oxidoreductase [Paradevosia shaoguanensis]|uniref:oxidoreductase n=1 Tax=Paradevosia shaoguanensis TaxID=1335043 RepID=UPI0019335A73|nr:oxidoreductase [Paradevosia shaoguanensis]
MAHWTAADIPDQTGRTIVITGANSGLGYVSALELARHGADVMMVVRDPAKGESARRAILSAVPDAKVELALADLADLDSIAAFASGFVASGRRLDVLMNNAGIMMPPRRVTKQGFELQFGTNHLAHFALTLQLLPAFAGSADARVVTMSSGLHKSGHIHFDDLGAVKTYSRSGAYSQSKIANVYFALELDRLLRAEKLPIKSVLAHPGYASTNLQSTGPTGFMSWLLKFGNAFMAQPPEMGALPQLYAATAPGVEGGQFYGPDGRNEMKGYPTLVQPVDRAKDPAIARRLWTVSEEMTGVRWP